MTNVSEAFKLFRDQIPVGIVRGIDCVEDLSLIGQNNLLAILHLGLWGKMHRHGSDRDKVFRLLVSLLPDDFPSHKLLAMWSMMFEEGDDIDEMFRDLVWDCEATQPYLPMLRPEAYFEIGSRMYYLSLQLGDRIDQEEWIEVEVQWRTRNQRTVRAVISRDPMTSGYRTDNMRTIGTAGDLEGYWFMKPEEMAFFRTLRGTEYERLLRIWHANGSDPDAHVDVDTFAQAVYEGQIKPFDRPEPRVARKH